MNARIHPFAAVFDDDELQRRLLIGEPIAFAQAEAECEELNGKFASLTTELEDLRFALSARECGEPPSDLVSAELKARFARFRALVATRPRQAKNRIDEIEGELNELQPKLPIARERLRLAKEAKAIALAATLRPRLREAVRGIASALEALSKAVAAEQEIQIEFRSAMPGFGMTDLGRDWRGCLLSDRNSVASEWVRRAKAAGWLDA